MTALNREILLDIIRKLQNAEGSEEEEVSWLETLERNVPHPEISDLIFYDDLSPEEILDRALKHTPISL